MTSTQIFLAVFFHNMTALSMPVSAESAQAAFAIAAEYHQNWRADGADALGLGEGEVEYNQLTRALEQGGWYVEHVNPENDWCLYIKA